METTNITKKLPNGMVLIAELNNDPDYPGIEISIKGTGTDNLDETICFVEFNSTKPENQELCTCVYTVDEDEPVYYASYNKPGNDLE